jgi:hypothetical protein
MMGEVTAAQVNTFIGMYFRAVLTLNIKCMTVTQRHKVQSKEYEILRESGSAKCVNSVRRGTSTAVLPC